MIASKKLLIFGGIALSVLGMLYGLHYAIFIEHQTLAQLGNSLTSAFARAAERSWGASESALVNYGDTKYKYVRQVDVHSHWIGLAMLMIVLGCAIDRVGFSERVRCWLAKAMLSGSVIFPLGVMLQTVNHSVLLGSALAVAGSAVVTLALAAMAWGFARASS
jgi:hypothetical protein